MHCKHCGNQIDNDSKFCSFCGGKTDQIIQTIFEEHPLTQVQNESTEILSEKPVYESSSNENGYLIAGIYFFTFQFIIPLIISVIFDDFFNKYVFDSIRIIFMGMPILLALYTKRKDYKTILFILGLFSVSFSIFVFIKSI